MVESVSSDEITRNITPRPSLHSADAMESFPGSGGGTLEGTSALYVYSRTIFSHSLEDSDLAKPHNLGASVTFMPGDASSKGMADQSGGSNRRPSSYNQPNQPRRPPLNSAASHQFSPENSLGSAHSSSPHYPPASQYGQRSGFFGQYTMSPKPPMAMAPSNPTYAYPHGFQSVPENTMMLQNIHGSYQSMIPPAPVYSFQRHPPEGASAGFPTQPMFSHPSQGNSPSPPMSSPSTSQNTTPPYPSHGQFHSLRYPTSMSPSQYSYSHHSYSPSPVYQSQYAPAPYPQHFSSPAEVENQGLWWYLPHAAPNAPPYPGHYTINYSPVHQESENAYPASTNAGPSVPPNYSVSPVHTPALLNTARRPPSLAASGEESPAPPSPGPIASSSKSPIGERFSPAVRRPYHPNPPSHRSEWVMWAGNVPSDATHDELWRFFNQSDDLATSAGVVSIFLISRSSCAFVNYESESKLQAAIVQFNGVPLRSHDPRCPRLVCRVRKIDDDLKAGVGGQRGVGMHTKWLRDQREKTKGKKKATDQSDHSDFDDSSSSIAAVSASSDDDSRPPFVKGTHSNSSGSYASTNSSLLTRHFPKRYFILKSLSQYDLDLSVQKNLWATQKHNEGILDQAYRTSNEVFLIFGVNKSGEFYGYAKMAGPVRKGEQRVSWATRTDSSASSRSSAGRAAISDTIPEEPSSPLQEHPPSSPSAMNFFPERESRLVEDSPAPITPAQDAEADEKSPAPILSKDVSVASAPAELGTQHHRITMSTPSAKLSLDNRLNLKMYSAQYNSHGSTSDDFELDESAPYRAIRSEDSGRNLDEHLSRLRLNSVEEEAEERADDPEKASDQKPETWGEPFKVEWICTDRLPFFRTRHLRNPWNHDREVKVSRDGTELEPGVGEQLLQEWNKLVEEGRQHASDPATAPPIAKPVPKRPGSTSKPTSTNIGLKGAKDRDTGLFTSRS